MSAMVLATSSRVIRNHSFRVADRGQGFSWPMKSNSGVSGQMPSRTFATINQAQKYLLLIYQ